MLKRPQLKLKVRIQGELPMTERRSVLRRAMLCLWLLILAPLSLPAQTGSNREAAPPVQTGAKSDISKTPEKPDLSKQPTLYVVGYAHLDTEWRWEYPQVINEYLRKTMKDNFDLFEKYPHYIFNFSGANRYRLMKEYFPADFAKLKSYVDSGRWSPAGSS